MQLTITMSFDNAGMREGGDLDEEHASGSAFAVILRKVADDFDAEYVTVGARQTLRDVNGNIVGTLTVTD